MKCIKAEAAPTVRVGAKLTDELCMTDDAMLRVQFEYKELGRLIKAVKLIDSWGMCTKEERDTMLNRINFYVQR